jgi:polysaccharide biosynthesis protein PslA
MSDVATPEVATPETETISLRVVSGLIRLADMVLLVLAGFVATLLVQMVYGQPSPGPLALATLAGSWAAAICLANDGAYKQAALQSVATQMRMLIKPLVIGMFCLVGCAFILYDGALPFRIWPLTWAAVAAAMIFAARLPICAQFVRWTEAGRLARKIAIVGVGDFSREFIERLREEPNAFRIVGIYDDRLTRVPPAQAGVPVLGTVEDLLHRSRLEAIDVIVIALPLSAVERIARILEQLGSTVADLCLTTDLAGLRFSGRQFGGIGSNLVVSITEAPLKDWRALEKMILDYGIGVVALILLSPVLAIVALLIRLDSPGPVLFRQPRLGFNNRMFLCYKFRTMHHGMTDLLADRQTTRNDPRITRIGKYLRKLSLDELPQLFNVLNGTMSLVGPRPHAPNTKAADRLFTEVVQQYALRHRVKPGITGWAQVNGWRGETKTVDQIEQRVKFDLFYIENWSVWLDLRILVMTVLREVASRHAY